MMKTLRQRLKYNPLKKSPRKGVALLLAITSLILMVYVASEVTKDSTLEYVVNSQEVNRIKAYYAARNSVDVALLRIKIFQQLQGMNLPGGFAQELDQIWKFPFAWPLPLPKSSFTKTDANGNVANEALFDGQYEHFIDDEGSKIDINDLASPSKTLQEITAKQILNIFEQKLDSDQAFADEYRNFNFTELINRITDWMSEVNTSKNGGDKRAAFQSLNTDGRSDYPPNRGFRTLEELRLVPGMNNVLFELLKPSITIYGMKAINPNVASELVLKSLDKNMTDEAIKAAIERREDTNKGGPFVGEDSNSCRTDFKNFVQGYGIQLDAEFEKIPFNCKQILNFRIDATGRSGSGKGAMQKKITAIVMDISSAGANVKNLVAEDKKASQQGGGQGGQSGQPGSGQPGGGQQAGSTSGQKDALPKGRPRIVYWSEI